MGAVRRATTCWVCQRQARGLGHSDNRFRIADPRRYRTDWMFCSRRCQDAFHALYGVWAATYPPQQEAFVIDASEMERASMRQCLKAFGEAAEGIGFDKPLGRYSEAEALRVIDAIVTQYTDAMTSAHEAALHRPTGVSASADDPFAGMKEDLPWEEGQ